MRFVDELTWRGLCHSKSNDKLGELLTPGLPLYCGFDPSAPSLHLGNFLQIVGLMRAQRSGLRPIALVGGATGMIGDPSGKSEERQLLSVETVEQNAAGIRRVLERFLDFGPGGALLVNNHDWFGPLSYLGFLREIGKLFSVNVMLAKDSVASRLEREQGLSYTEFSYMLIQAYDYLRLYEDQGCRLQVGGSDQWGNITLGIDLIRRKHGVEAYGLVQPLITTASGQKFGKTEKGAVWLTADRTPPFDFYQFFVQQEDRIVGQLLRYFTFLNESDIALLDREIAERPEKREAQRVLAREMTRLVHGEEETIKAEHAAKALFERPLRELDTEAIQQLFRDAPSSMNALADLEGAGLNVVEALLRSKLCDSKSGARRDIQGGGIYVNEERVSDHEHALTQRDLVAGHYVVLRKGKKTHHLLRFQ
jgi:tyrosyl-tRNA synthetase